MATGCLHKPFDSNPDFNQSEPFVFGKITIVDIYGNEYYPNKVENRVLFEQFKGTFTHTAGLHDIDKNPEKHPKSIYKCSTNLIPNINTRYHYAPSYINPGHTYPTLESNGIFLASVENSKAKEININTVKCYQRPFNVTMNYFQHNIEKINIKIRYLDNKFTYFGDMKIFVQPKKFSGTTNSLQDNASINSEVKKVEIFYNKASKQEIIDFIKETLPSIQLDKTDIVFSKAIYDE